MHLAPMGDAVWICCVINIKILFRGFFSVCRSLPNNAEWFDASIGNAHYKGEKKNMDLRAAFCLFIRTLKTAKLKGKQTSTAGVLNQFRSFATITEPPSFSLPTTFKVTGERSRIRIRTKMSRIPNTGSKCWALRGREGCTQITPYFIQCTNLEVKSIQIM